MSEHCTEAPPETETVTAVPDGPPSGELAAYAVPAEDAPRETLVFVHIPKTAGTAFSHYLRRHCGAPEKVLKTFYGDYSIYDGVRDAPLVLGHTYYREMAPRFPEAAFLTWLRHPVDRVVSQYKSWHNPKNLGRHWQENAADRDTFAHLFFTQAATFEEFALSDLPAVLDNITNVQTRMLSSHAAAGPAGPLGRLLDRGPLRRRRTRREEARMLASAKENLERGFAFFGIVERFEDSIGLFRRTFGWEAEFRDDERAANRGAPLQSVVTGRALKRVIERNELDLELYEFACKLFADRLGTADRGTAAG